MAQARARAKAKRASRSAINRTYRARGLPSNGRRRRSCGTDAPSETRITTREGRGFKGRYREDFNPRSCHSFLAILVRFDSLGRPQYRTTGRSLLRAPFYLRGAGVSLMACPMIWPGPGNDLPPTEFL